MTVIESTYRKKVKQELSPLNKVFYFLVWGGGEYLAKLVNIFFLVFFLCADAILRCIGFDGQANHLTSDYSKLSYHCQGFGCYAR